MITVDALRKEQAACRGKRFSWNERADRVQFLRRGEPIGEIYAVTHDFFGGRALERFRT